MNALSTLRLYEIAGDYLQALEALGEIDDVPLEDIANTLQTLQGTFEQKAINVAAYIRNLEAEATAVEEARKHMERRQRALENHANRLREYLKWHMERTGVTRIKNCQLALRVQANPPSVKVDDEALIPDWYKQQVITIKVLRSEIAKALKSGELVPGARLEQSNRLVIQ